MTPGPGQERNAASNSGGVPLGPALPDEFAWYERYEKAWADHPELEQLIELSRERDESRQKTWQVVREIAERDGWVEYRLRPMDPFDSRPTVLIAAWPEHVELSEDADLLARVDEHFT